MQYTDLPRKFVRFTVAGLGLLAAIASLALMGMAFAQVGSSDWSVEVIHLGPNAEHEQPPLAVAVDVHPKGKVLAIAGDDHQIRIWDLVEERVVRELRGHSDWVRALTYSPDGRYLASSGNDRRIIIWDTSTGKILRKVSTLKHAITELQFSPDSATLASVGFGDKLRLFDTATGRQIREMSCPCIDMRALAFASNRDLLAGGGRNGKIRIWDAKTGEMFTEFSAHRQRIRDLQFSPDGSSLASCGEDREVRLSSIDGEEVLRLPTLDRKVMALTFVGPDKLATAGSDNLIRIWELNATVEVARLAGHTGSIMKLVYRGDLLVSTGYDTTVRVWRRDNNVAEGFRTPDNRVGRSRDHQIR